MLKMVDGTGIIGVDMVCPLGGTVSPPQPPNYDKVEMEGVGSLMLPNSLKAPLERVELLGNSTQGENPAPDNPQEIKSAGRFDEASGKYLFDVKVTGKNLFDREKARDITNWIVRDGNGYAKFPIRVGKGNKVTFYYSEKLTTGKGFYVGITQSETSAIVSWLYHSAETNLNNKKYTAVAAGDYIYLSCTISGIQKFVDTIQTLQVEIGSEQTEYEPYTEQTVQIALNEPLRGIGEYNDTITKDGVVRKIKRIVFDGSEDEKWGLSREHENHINFALVIKGAITVNTGIRTMMDKFKYFGAIWNSDLLGQDMFGAALRINMPKTLATDLQTFKTWLSQNPLTVDYVLAEPITEPLPESVQQQLQALHTENGTTHVFVDSGEVPCGIKLTYRKEI